MPIESDKQPLNSAAAVVDNRDPQKITDLIEQLEHDLAETKKSTAKQR